MLDIVVAYYHNKNFIDFLNKLNNFDYSYKIIVYDKSNKNLKSDKSFISIQKLENVGREGETYLNHIINNYDNLNEYTLFIQDDTNEHIPNYIEFIKECTHLINNKTKFKLFPCSWRINSPPIIRSIKNGMCPNDLQSVIPNNSIKESCKSNNIYLPQLYRTETCAFFICHKNVIWKHDKSFYIKLRKWLLNNKKNIKKGVVLEHMWKLIFTERISSYSYL